jgi:hypothetical protein
MTSKIKVDNIENQCGGAVVTKCGATTTISGSVVKADDIQAADGGNIINQCGTTITLGASGDTINLASGASQTGFGRTGTVDWDTTAKTATFSAVSGNGYFCNTTGGAFTVNLPAGSAGAIVSLADYAATWQTNNLTVSPNGTEKIGGVNADVDLSTEGQSVTFVYVDSTQGWVNTMDSTSNVRAESLICASVSGACNTLTTIDTNFKLATFTGPGTFTVNSGQNFVDYVVVAGGGGGGGDDGGGGGGGGFRESHCATISGCYTASPLATPTSLPLGPGAFPITVGGGGTGSPVNGTNGSNSVFSSITSAGGGFGGRNPVAGGPGGSGGGGGGGTSGAGGTGNTPPVTPAQGTNGGNATPANNGGGGGGGATAIGANGSGCGSGASAGPGGAGATTNITGSSVTRAGGGGGGAFLTKGNAGSGGGGTGAQYPNTQATEGTVNTGGGGGGGSTSTGCRTGKSGGSGIVIIRYKFQ